jgi:lipoic acid synthetase
VPRIFKRIRPAFRYERSLDVITQGHAAGLITKSNLILGMGERRDEVPRALEDIAEAGAEIVTIGQYLQPTPYHLPVDRWVTPDEFAEWKRVGESMGIAHVEAGPLVRSSYHAGTQFRRALEANPALVR